MCHGECTWAEDSCVENKPLPVYKGFAIIKIILFIKQISFFVLLAPDLDC